MKKRTADWLNSAEYRLNSAKILLKGSQYLDAVFHCQQAIEFMLKAVLSERKEEEPPREHDLLALSEALGLPFPEELQRILNELHDVSVPVRYPDNFDETVAAYDAEQVDEFVKETQTLLQWLRQRLN